jgi:two-component system, LytTR family, sensor histidine kinase AlgZ
MENPNTPAETTLASAGHSWIPNFLSPRALLMLAAASEVIVLIALLAGSPDATHFWARLGPASLLAQWIALCVALSLTLLAPRLPADKHVVSAITALLVVGCVTFCCVLLSAAAQSVIIPSDYVSANSSSAGFAARMAFVAMLVCAAALRYAYVQRQWALEVQASARVKVEALTARIRPHFLFNSMNTLASLISIDPVRAEQVVEDLSELFRAALRAGEHEVSLAQELDLAKQYLRIEQLRLGPRLQVEYALENLPMDLRMPALLLQPLVENAVYHGVQPLADGGLVRLSALSSGGFLQLKVENPYQLSQHSGNGMAQQNIRARLRLAFGENADLKTEMHAGNYVATLIVPLPLSISSPISSPISLSRQPSR